jgi:urease subunit gamma
MSGRGVKLNYPEAMAYISPPRCWKGRDGRTVASVHFRTTLLTRDPW